MHPNAKERRKDLDKCRTRFRIYHSATEKIPTLTGPPCISLPFILGAGGPCLRILLLLLTSRDSMFANNHQDVESCARKICGSTVHSLPYTHFVIFDFTFFFPFARCQRETRWTITMKATLGLSRLIHDIRHEASSKMKSFSAVVFKKISIKRIKQCTSGPWIYLPDERSCKKSAVVIKGHVNKTPAIWILQNVQVYT